MRRLLLAIRCFFAILFGRPLPIETVGLLPAPAPADGLNRGALQLLALLQREGRLIDFLEEDIASYSDGQIGAAVRGIHQGCHKALEEHFGVQPVLSQADNSTVRVEAGFDPGRIRLVGNVVGEPPFTGILKHPGWRAATVRLPDAPDTLDPSVITPAEVELS